MDAGSRWVAASQKGERSNRSDHQGGIWTDRAIAESEPMKTTVEIPDVVFRKAKARAAEQGIPLHQFVTAAVEEKLKTSAVDKPWMKIAGGLRHLHKKNVSVHKLIR